MYPITFFDPPPLPKLLHLCNASPWLYAVLLWLLQYHPSSLALQWQFYPLHTCWASYLSLSLLDLYLFYLPLYPKIIESPHLLVSWRPATLQHQYLISLSLRNDLLLPLRYYLFDILLYASFFSIFLHYASIGSAHYPQDLLLRFSQSVSSLIIFDCSSPAPFCLLHYVLLA